MGNKQTQNFEWENKFIILERNFNDNTVVLQKINGSQQYLGREIISTDKRQSDEIKRLIYQKYNKNNPFLTKLAEVYYNNDSAYCSPQDKIHLVFEKPDKTLRQQILARKFANESFSEEQADIILESGAKAIRYLKQIEHPHNNISTSSIFIDENRKILLGDPWITPPIYSQDMNQNVFACPSPQKILLQNDQIMSICSFRSDIFSLGMVVLEVLNFQHMDVLYEKGFRRLVENRVKEKLAKVKNEQLRYKLSVVLSHDPANRDQIFRLYRTSGFASQSVSQVKNKAVKGMNNNQVKLKKESLQKKSPIAELKIIKDNPAQMAQAKYKKIMETNMISHNNYGKQAFMKQNPSINNQYNGIVPTNQIDVLKLNNMNEKKSVYTPIPVYNASNGISYQHNTNHFAPNIHNNTNNGVIKGNNYSNYNYMKTTTPLQNYQPLEQKPINNSIMSNLDNKLGTNTLRPVLATPTVNITHTSNHNLNRGFPTVNNNDNFNAPVTNYPNGNPYSHVFNQYATHQEFNPIKSADDFVKTSGSIKYIEHSGKSSHDLTGSKEEIDMHSGSYGVKSSQPVVFKTTPKQSMQVSANPIPIAQNPQKATIALSPPVSAPIVAPPIPIAPSTQANKQTPDRKPSRKYNSTIKEQPDQNSYSGSRDGQPERLSDEQLEFVHQEYESGKYEGQKKNNMRNGYGKFIYNQGSVYQGQWKDNLMHGKGSLYYSNGKLAYEGSWHMDQFHGYGKVYNEDQMAIKGSYDYTDFSDVNDYWASYEGQLNSDRRHGKGKIRFSNGQIFVGTFVNDIVEGQGKFYTVNGEIINGIWKGNRLVKKL